MRNPRNGDQVKRQDSYVPVHTTWRKYHTVFTQYLCNISLDICALFLHEPKFYGVEFPIDGVTLVLRES